MDFNDYQHKASQTAIYNPDAGLCYTTLGLAGETGEIFDKLLKYMFNNEEPVGDPALPFEFYYWLNLIRSYSVKCEMLKKGIRDKGEWAKLVTPFGIEEVRKAALKITPEQKQEIAKELGDVLWYISELARNLDLNLNYIAELNISKLYSRQQNNQLNGSGDNR